MKILVCMGHVPDTTTKVKFTENNSQLDKSGIQWIINPWDELALTRALELKESGKNIESITVANVGPVETEPTIRKALAVGADNAIRIDAPAKDAYFVAAQLAEVVKKHSFDLIFCGIENSDYNNSSVGGMLAAFLGYNSVSSVSHLEIEGDKVVVKQEIEGGFLKVEAGLPLIAIVQKGIAKEPRIPAMRGIMMARKKPLDVIPAIDMNSMVDFMAFEYPESKQACTYIDAEDMEKLVGLLHQEAKVI